MDIRDRIFKIRNLMKDNNIDAYIIPSSDYHQSEYVSDYFKCRQFISGFTGSAGTILITLDKAILWTDGRYFIQAEKELENTTIELFKMGEKDVPSLNEFISSKDNNIKTLGFDGKVLSAKQIDEIKTLFKDNEICFKYDLDLINMIWEDRPSLPCEKAFILDKQYAGEDFSSKLTRVRKEMANLNSTVHLITTLDDIAWLFNIRGFDVSFNPVVLSYAAITSTNVYLFIQKDALSDEVSNVLKDNNITVCDYFELYNFVPNISENEVVLLDSSKVNYSIFKGLNSNIKIVDTLNPTINMKCIKNKVELENLRNSHIKDGIAFTKFMHWVKTSYKNELITEMSASKKLENFRREQDKFIEPSFNTIAGFKDHAAMMHYSANENTDYKIEGNGLFLIDSGGQYLDGTTDITRTLVIGEVDSTLKTHFTAVVKGMISLSMAKFLDGVRGVNLDILARGPIWNLGIDYKCGTGHGIGFLLNVHEAPNGFRWRIVPERNDSAEFKEGMVTTNEPGIYIENSHGIRIENELVCQKAENTPFGQFMNFETITFAPIDLDAINVDELSISERKFLNEYHALVFEKVSKGLTNTEANWLKHYARAI